MSLCLLAAKAEKERLWRMHHQIKEDMNMNQNLSRETVCVQGGWQPKNGEARVLPIYQSTTFKYETSEQMGRLFDLEENGYFYITI